MVLIETYSLSILIISPADKDEIPEEILIIVVEAEETLDAKETFRDFLATAFCIIPSMVIITLAFGSLYESECVAVPTPVKSKNTLVDSPESLNSLSFNL